MNKMDNKSRNWNHIINNKFIIITSYHALKVPIITITTLIFSISQYLIGDSSEIKYKMLYPLTNLKCPKLQDFRWSNMSRSYYKQSFK